MRNTLTSFLALAIALGIGACKDKDRTYSGDDIPIGEYASLTGKEQSFGQSSHKGTQLAVEEINAAGGVLGKKIRLITLDDRSDQTEAKTAVGRLIDQNVVAILGEVASSRSLIGAPLCQKSKVPMLTPSSTNPDVTKVGDYIFRICFTDDFQGAAAAEFALSKGWKRMSIFTDAASDYSKGLSKGFKEAYAAGGGTLLIEVHYSSQESDFKTLLIKLKDSNPDAIFLPGYYTEVVKILTQAREIGLTVPILGGDGWDSAATLAVGAAAEGCFFTNHYSADEPRKEVQDFVKAYQARYQEAPDAMAVLGYDSARVMADAIKRAGSLDRAAIRDALAKTENFVGPSGTITIDENRNARKPIVVLELRGGKAHLVQTIAPKD